MGCVQPWRNVLLPRNTLGTTEQGGVEGVTTMILTLKRTKKRNERIEKSQKQVKYLLVKSKQYIDESL